MSEYGFRDFLAESFAALRQEMFPAYREMCRHLDGRTVALRVDSESSGIRFEAEDVRWLNDEKVWTIEVDTDSFAILDLVEARCALHEVVCDDRLILRGDVSDLLRFHDALMMYLHGAVRAPSFPSLLRRFRATAMSRAALSLVADVSRGLGRNL